MYTLTALYYIDTIISILLVDVIDDNVYEEALVANRNVGNSINTNVASRCLR